MSMAWEPDRRSNFFFSPPAHLCAVTYMTEISLIVTLNNQFNSTQSFLLQHFLGTLCLFLIFLNKVIIVILYTGNNCGSVLSDNIQLKYTIEGISKILVP